MKQKIAKKEPTSIKVAERIVLPVSTLLFFIGLFLYIFFRIDTSLYNIAKEPFFQATPEFFIDFLSYPGGLADYLNIFISQFFEFPVPGAILLTLIVLGLSIATQRLFHVVNKSGIGLLHLLPAALVVGLQSNYYHSLSTTISLTLALFAASFFVSIKNKSPVIRFLLFIFVASLVYFTCGGSFLLFALLCIIFESFTSKKPAWVLGYIAYSACIPYISGEFLFLISFHDAFLYSLAFNFTGYNHPIITYILYAFFPVVLITILIINKRIPITQTLKSNKPHSSFINNIVFKIVSLVIVITGTAVIILTSYNRVDAISLRTGQNVRNGNWHGILVDFQKSWVDNRLTNYAMNQALFYLGLHSTDMFSFPQSYGDRGLFLFGDDKSDYWEQDGFYFMYRSELFLKLGLVNEAEQWGYEALSVEGKNAWSLKRLCQIHALNNEIPMTIICLNILESSPLHSAWAKKFRTQVLDNSFKTKEADQLLNMVSLSMPTKDFTRKSYTQPSLDLEEALHQHPVNRFTFEYCMGAFLLQGNLPRMALVAPYLDTLGYQEVPKVYEEALLMLKSVSFPTLPSVANRISPVTLERYAMLNSILSKYSGNLKNAEKEVVDNLWDTYWYYCFYTLPERLKKP